MNIGIDLGTTNTVVSYFDENNMFNIFDFGKYGRPEDSRLLPSAVAFDSGTPLVGQEAAEHRLKNPADFCESRKREMGMGGSTWYVGGEGLTPEDITRCILNQVYSCLQNAFPDEAEFNAFVTVPAGFTMSARIATREALRAAGFSVGDNCLVDEPVAAAIAYRSEFDDNDKLVLVVDCGGGTFDLSLLKMSAIGGSLTPVAVGCDMTNNLELGGNAVDEKLFRDMVRTFDQQAGTDILNDGDENSHRAAVIIRSKILGLKNELYHSDRHEGHVYITNLLNNTNFEYKISKDKYKQLMQSGKNNIPDGYRLCINNLFVGLGEEFTKSKVDKVLAAGGMADELCLNEILRGFFSKKLIVPKEDKKLFLVSKGAAICNSPLKIPVENVAYSSVGILIEKGQDVENIISEGEKIDTGRLSTMQVYLSESEADYVWITVVEYKGKFRPDRYITLLREQVPVNYSAQKVSAKLLGMLGKDTRPYVELEFILGEDKIMEINVRQKNNKKKRLEIRLGGK